MDFVLEHLAIGNAEEATNPPYNVSALLNVAQEIDLPHSRLLAHKVPITDMRPIPDQQLKEAVEWIRDHIEQDCILVFCNAGVGRSSSVIVAYLCLALGYGFGAAVEFVARRRPYMSILPNLIVTIDSVRRQMSSHQ